MKQILMTFTHKVRTHAGIRMYWFQENWKDRAISILPIVFCSINVVNISLLNLYFKFSQNIKSKKIEAK